MIILPINSSIAENVVYLSHHEVLRKSAVSMKLRVVFDASFKTSSGMSLDELMIGATLQDPIVNIVLRFRIYPIVLMADLKKMYRQILLHVNDQNYQRIL